MTLPTTAKAWVALVGTVLLFVSTQFGSFLPPTWQAILSGLIGLLTVFGVYRVPNQVTQKQVDNAIAKGHVTAPQTYKPPWPKP